MLQFDDLVRGASTVREVREKFPETGPVFKKFKMRESCCDCPLTYAARRSGAALDDLLVEVNQTIYRQRGIPA